MLTPTLIGDLPKETLNAAQASFPKGNLYSRQGEVFRGLYQDEAFRDLFPPLGRPALPAWRLAWVTVCQFLENLTDRQAADAVGSRIDWKCALGLKLSDSGFNYSVLSEVRSRFIKSDAGSLLLDKMLEHFKAQDLLAAQGKQRSDSTRVLANIRVLNLSELVGGTVRAALNELAVVAPQWLTELAPESWYERYARRVEAYRLPKSKAGREDYLRRVAADGFSLLDAVDQQAAPPELPRLKQIEVLGKVWARYFEPNGKGCLLAEPAVPVAEALVSP